MNFVDHFWTQQKNHIICKKHEMNFLVINSDVPRVVRNQIILQVTNNKTKQEWAEITSLSDTFRTVDENVSFAVTTLIRTYLVKFSTSWCSGPFRKFKPQERVINRIKRFCKVHEARV